MAKKKVVKKKEPELAPTSELKPAPIVASKPLPVEPPAARPVPAPGGRHYRMSDHKRPARAVLGYATTHPNAVDVRLTHPDDVPVPPDPDPVPTEALLSPIEVEVESNEEASD